MIPKILKWMLFLVVFVFFALFIVGYLSENGPEIWSKINISYPRQLPELPGIPAGPATQGTQKEILPGVYDTVGQDGYHKITGDYLWIDIDEQNLRRENPPYLQAFLNTSGNVNKPYVFIEANWTEIRRASGYETVRPQNGDWFWVRLDSRYMAGNYPLIRMDDGGDLMTKVKLLSAKAVITTGNGRPGSIPWVCALNALQNSMMFKPR